GQPLQVLTTSLPQATTGVNYRQVIATSGGTPPLRWSFVAAPWCCVNFDSGVFSGVPERAQGQPLSVTGSVGVMDATGVGAGQTYTLTVVAGPVYISSASLPNPISGWVYDQFLTAAGGIEPYTLSIVSGGLPPGLTLNSTTGEIHGIPASSGTFTFTVQAVDSSSPAKSGSATMTLVVQAGP
ncbi:MAG TPA: cadherin repeat domain-containing protein, partial [Terriglobales bacterium]|nr:cadherin repeat domain-containing protein [Terriglobales bacterium]